MNKKTKISIFLIGIILVLSYSVFLMVRSDDPIDTYLTVKGGEVESVEWSNWDVYKPQIEALNLSWVRIHVRWYLLDDGYGDFDFAGNQYYERYREAIRFAKDSGAEVILTIKGVPGDLKDPNPIKIDALGTDPVYWPDFCGRIVLPEGVDRLRQFTVALLDQLRMDLGYGPSDPPPVRYIELWNEPDAPAYLSIPEYYGCWVSDFDDPASASFYEAGYYYAAVLNAVAPYVKSQFPTGSVKFVAAAVAETEGENGDLHEFLRAVIDNTLGIPGNEDNLDVISYHQYAYAHNSDCRVDEKIKDYETSFTLVRNYLDRYGDEGGKDIPILISEGAMKYEYYSPSSLSQDPISTPLVPTQTPSSAFYDCQASFATTLLSWAEGKTGKEGGNLLGFIWYTIGYNGWKNTDLLYSNGTPKPVYFIWKDLGPQLIDD